MRDQKNKRINELGGKCEKCGETKKLALKIIKDERVLCHNCRAIEVAWRG